MAERVLGLDVGTTAVRVVEVVLDRPGGRWPSAAGPVVTRVGEVPLPPGAVRDGEVVDAAAVGAAITELWRQTGLRSREVRVGLTGRPGRRPGHRDAGDARRGAWPERSASPPPTTSRSPSTRPSSTMPSSSRLPPAEPGGPPMVRVLIAAAHRSTLDGLLAAVAAGGAPGRGRRPHPLRPRPGPVPARRPVGRRGGARGRGRVDPAAAAGPAEAIVSVGAALTTVVVHEAGRPKFVRTVAGRRRHADRRHRRRARHRAPTRPRRPSGMCRRWRRRRRSRPRAARVVELRLAGILGEIQSCARLLDGPVRPAAPADRPDRWRRPGRRHRRAVGPPGRRPGGVGRRAGPRGARARRRLRRLGRSHRGRRVGPRGRTPSGWQIDLCPPGKRSLPLHRRAWGARLAVAAAVVVVLLGGLERALRAGAAQRAQRTSPPQKKAIARVRGGDRPVQRPPASSTPTSTADGSRCSRPWPATSPGHGSSTTSSGHARGGVDPVAVGPDDGRPSAGHGRQATAGGRAERRLAPGRRPASARCRSPSSGSTSPTPPTGSARWPATRRCRVSPSAALSPRAAEGPAATVGFSSTATITPAARSDRAARLAKAAL